MIRKYSAVLSETRMMSSEPEHFPRPFPSHMKGFRLSGPFKLSAKFRNIAMMPHTLLWSKPLYRPDVTWERTDHLTAGLSGPSRRHNDCGF
jgi:hypothetical protein